MLIMRCLNCAKLPVHICLFYPHRWVLAPVRKQKSQKKVIFNTKQGLTRQTSDAKLVPKSIISSSYDQNAQVWLQKVYRPLGLLPVACTAAPWFRHYKNWCLKTNQKGSI
jgi:hypothetical protein